MVRVACNTFIPVDSGQSHPLRLAVVHTLWVLPRSTPDTLDVSTLSAFSAPPPELPVRLGASTIPESIAVRLNGSRVRLRVLGFLNGRRIDPHRVLKSGIVHELTRFIRKVSALRIIQMTPARRITAVAES